MSGSDNLWARRQGRDGYCAPPLAEAPPIASFAAADADGCEVCPLELIYKLLTLDKT